MAHLGLRENWELEANRAGSNLRDEVFDTFKAHLDEAHPGEYIVTKEPKSLRQLYYEADYAKHPTAYEMPATPTKDDVWFDADLGCFVSLTKGGSKVIAMGGGCIPDLEIRCVASGRSYFIECKQQNDAGNAHERAAKYATQSMIEQIQKKLGVTYHPIGWLFSGSLVDKRKYIIELQTTYGFAADHLLLWKKERNHSTLITWLTDTILPLLGAA